MKRALGLIIIAAIGAGVGAYYVRRGGPEIQVNTAPITRGDIVDTVGATGTLQAVTTVQVGSQVSGNIQWLGADFNSIVKKGQVIARLDPSLFQTPAPAGARQSDSDARESDQGAERPRPDARCSSPTRRPKYNRAKELAARSLLPQSELDAAKIAVDTAQATVASQQATVTQTRAAVSQAQASVSQDAGEPRSHRHHGADRRHRHSAQRRRRPDRRREHAGADAVHHRRRPRRRCRSTRTSTKRTSAASVRVSTSRSASMRTRPTAFDGTVAQVRLQPVVVQNVTTYGTVIDVPNPELKLKPGMTANVKVEIAKRTDVPAGAERRAAVPADAGVVRRANQPSRRNAGLRPGADSGRRIDRRGRGHRYPGSGRAGARHRPAASGRFVRRPPMQFRRQSTSRRGGGPGAGRRSLEAARTVAGWRARRDNRAVAAASVEAAGAAIRSRAHDGALQDDVARGTEAVHRAHERARPGHEPRSKQAAKAAAQPAAPTKPKTARPPRRRRSTRCSRRCRSSRRAAAPGCS